MKRFTLILVWVLMVATPMMAERVNPETARKVAATFLSNNGAKTAQLTDLSKATGFSNLYIFTAEQGFVVMAADDCVKPILGYSLTGNFITEDMPENVRGWLQGYNDQIEQAIARGIKSTADIKQVWQDLHNGKAGVSGTTPIVDALVKTKWDQGDPFNKLCPIKGSQRTVTGCVATAMAQVMKYWEYPATGTGSHSYTWNGQTLSADFSATTYDWENMINTYSSTSNTTQETSVATLMYHCGVSVEMDYGISSAGGSSASTYDVMYALQTYFSYATCMHYEQKENYSDAEWFTMLKNELNDGRPLQYRGSDAGGNGGHSFVCDGYDSEDNFHFNWGWSGYCDGFYAIDDMEPGTGGIGAGNGVYTVGQSAIFGIEPISTLVAPTLSVETAEGCINLTWNVISEADSYDVYRNNVQIATNVTENSYTDNLVVSGTYYEYYVRAVNGETKSNPSNFVTKYYLYRNLAPSNLTVTYSGNDATLSWTRYENNFSTELHYGTDPSGYIWGSNSQSTYWAQRYPVGILSKLIGMEIEKISACFYYASGYSLYIYNGDLTEADKIYHQDFTKSSQNFEWIDFNFNNPLAIDCSKDLWIVFYNNDENVSYPALSGDYENDDVIDAKYMSSSLDNLSNNYATSDNISWLFRTYFTDGTYTYNIYDGETQLNTEAVIGTSYTHNDPDNDAAHQYTVKTNYYGGESEASNMAGLALGTASLNSLEMNADDKMTVTRGSTLSVSGTLSNANPDNLILENGSQLINNSEGVKATMKKSIAAYETDKDGWNLIASPFIESFEPTDANGLLTNNYDLYMFDQSEEKEWRNYKANSFATIDHKNGYLYANSDETTLTFTGTLANIATATPLVYNDNARFKGFNLIGNPFPCEAYIDRSFYVLKEDGSDFTVGSNPIPPCAAILVQAQNASDNSVTFSKTASKTDSSIIAQLKTADIKDSNFIDQARVNFNENDNLVKYSFDNNASSLYFPHESNNFAAVSFAGQSEMPLNFNVKHNGSYTLSFEMENADVDYLHLIDNMTGEDIDLLTNKSYTFEASTNDYAFRFRLVFAHEDGPSTSSGAFAFVSNGEIVINQEGTLQIVDMTGRMVASRNGRIQSVPTRGMTSGVYVLRLINGDNVKTQKIVIE